MEKTGLEQPLLMREERVQSSRVGVMVMMVEDGISRMMFIIELNSCGSLSMEHLSAVLMDRRQGQ